MLLSRSTCVAENVPSVARYRDDDRGLRWRIGTPCYGRKPVGDRAGEEGSSWSIRVWDISIDRLSSVGILDLLHELVRELHRLELDIRRKRLHSRLLDPKPACVTPDVKEYQRVGFTLPSLAEEAARVGAGKFAVAHHGGSSGSQERSGWKELPF